MTSRSKLPATIDFQEPVARLPVVLVIGSGPSPTTDLQVLLRKRLKFLGLFGSMILVSLAIFLVVPLFQKDIQPAEGYGLFILQVCVQVVLLGGLTGLMWSRRPLSLGQLRSIETLAFIVLLAQIAWVRYWDLRQYGLALAQLEGPPISPPRYSASYSLPFFALIIAYGAIIPNTWQRALGMLGGTAVLAIVLAAGTALSEGVYSVHLIKALLVPSSLHLASVVAIAVYGSHRITVLRHESLTARRLGQYQLTRRLGAGGMGEVYLAEHALLRRPCAIKLIRAERSCDPASLHRFEREVQATAKLTNWHTVEIFDYGHAVDGTFYYVMEYLPGLNLDELVRRHGPLPPERVVHLLRQLCSALQEAHGVGLIHRDIKPSNVITGERGGLPDVAKLLDFGLVQIQGVNRDGNDLAQDSAIAGTPSYMSPEQATGKLDLDGRSDVYSLGALGYFLLTGQPPFVRDTATQLMSAHVCEAAAAPDRLRPGLPLDLQKAVLKCLEKDPARRYQSASDLDEALAKCNVQ